MKRKVLIALYCLCCLCGYAQTAPGTAYVLWSEVGKTMFFLTSNEVIEVGATHNEQVISHVWQGEDVTQSGDIPSWSEIVSNKVTKVIIEESFGETYPQKTRRWFNDCVNLTEIIGLRYLNTKDVTDMNGMFRKCSKLSSVDVSHFVTDKVKNMQIMFAYCSSLRSLDLSSFNTECVTNMTGMFAESTNLKSIDVSSFNTKNVETMNLMFYNCNSLESLDIRSLDTRNVTTMDGMFYGCNKLQELDVRGFSTENVTDMGWMFWGCRKLTNLDLNKFNTVNVTRFQAMFGECYNIKELNLSSWDTSKAETMRSMFFKCTNLTNLDISSFNTVNVQTMKYMFCHNENLRELNLSSFKTSHVEDTDSMFYSCYMMKTILVGDEWDMSNVVTSKHMFCYCHNLVGDNGTIYDSNHVDALYAHIDESGNPGYLTPYRDVGMEAILHMSDTEDEWYSIDGKLSQGKPRKTGVYIHNQSKVILK